MNPFLTCSSPPHPLHRSAIRSPHRRSHCRSIWAIYAALKPSEEPLGETGLGLLEDRAGEQGVLLATGDALVDDLGLERVGIVVPASSATEAFRPAGLEQVLPALLVGAEPGHER